MKKATAKFEKLTIPTYRPGAQENLPMFFEKNHTRAQAAGCTHFPSLTVSATRKPM